MNKIQINCERITNEILKTNTCFNPINKSNDPDLLFLENRIINELISKSPYININRNSSIIFNYKTQICLNIDLDNSIESILTTKLNGKDSLDLKVYRLISELKDSNIKDEELTNLIYKNLLTNKKYLKKIDILNIIFPKNDYINFKAIPYKLNYSDKYATINGLKLFKVKSHNEILDFLRGIVRIIFFKMEKGYIKKDDSFLDNFPMEVIDTISIRKEYQNLNFLNEIKLFKNEVCLKNIVDIYNYLHLNSKKHNFVEVIHTYRWCLENLPESNNPQINEVLKNKYILLSNINTLLSDYMYLDSESIKLSSKKITKFNPQNKKMIDSLAPLKKICRLINEIYTPCVEINKENKADFIFIDEDGDDTFRETFYTNTTNYFKEQLLKLLIFYFKDSSKQLQDIKNKEKIISNMKNEIKKFYNTDKLDSIFNPWNDLCDRAVKDLIIPKITNESPNLFIDGYFICENKWVYIEDELLSKNFNTFDDSIKSLIEEFGINNIESMKTKMNDLMRKKSFNRDEKYKFKKRIKSFYEKMLIDIETIDKEQIKEVEKYNNNINNLINII